MLLKSKPFAFRSDIISKELGIQKSRLCQESYLPLLKWQKIYQVYLPFKKAPYKSESKIPSIGLTNNLSLKTYPFPFTSSFHPIKTCLKAYSKVLLITLCQKNRKHQAKTKFLVVHPAVTDNNKTFIIFSSWKQRKIDQNHDYKVAIIEYYD